ncbi:MAG TPA: hydroxyacylglutathione hydrolase [Burkholderiales bacterium]|nr:hydroxyacylglutathione hydrolase [Burkholderiales bacterium]
MPAFADNYIWCLRSGTAAAVVDPGDADPVLEYLDAQGLRLAAILCTHLHGDHVGGNAELLRRFPVPVYGPRSESIATVNRPLGEGNRVDLPEFSLTLQVLEVPGHTAGHIAYLGDGMLFCGDTLFAAGCGRLLGGTAEQMSRSLARLAALPPDTRVYCAHEYTLANIRFARKANPGNAALRGREAVAQETRARGEPTLPSTIALERATNPFLRCNDAEVIASAERHAGRRLGDGVSVFAALRDWKNGFR